MKYKKSRRRKEPEAGETLAHEKGESAEVEKAEHGKRKRIAKRPAKLGTGARFKALKTKLGAKGATNPGALAAYIGRKKYGVKKFQSLAAKGKKKRSAAVPIGSKNPFATIKTDAQSRAGQKFHPGILAKNSPQNKFLTGKKLLANAMRKLRHG